MQKVPRATSRRANRRTRARHRAALSVTVAICMGTLLVASITQKATGSRPPGITATARPARVVLYGDSLAVQSQRYFDFFAAETDDTTVVNHVMSGAAPCGWLPQMLSDARRGDVTTAVIEFSGNAFGCMDLPVGSAQYYAAYRRQVTEAVKAFTAAGAHSFLIGAPMTYAQVQRADTRWDQLNEIYASIAASVPGVTFVNAGAAVEQGQRFTWTLPCLYFEPLCPPGGYNIVRAADGNHFCPQEPNAGTACASWPSGAFRYGMAMAAPVARFLTAGTAPAYEGDPLPAPGTRPEVAPDQRYPYATLHDALTTVRPLSRGQTLQPIGAAYTAVLQPDGNFVVRGPAGPVWASGTTGTGADRLVLGTDGDLVLYAGTRAVWSTGTRGTGGDYLAILDDGQLVLYGPSGVVWSTRAAAPSRSHQTAVSG